MRFIATDGTVCVSLCVGHSGEPCKTDEPINMPFYRNGLAGPVEPCNDR